MFLMSAIIHGVTLPVCFLTKKMGGGDIRWLGVGKQTWVSLLKLAKVYPTQLFLIICYSH